MLDFIGHIRRCDFLPGCGEEVLPFHKYLTEGIDIEFRKDSNIRGDKVYLVDFRNPDNNLHLNDTQVFHKILRTDINVTPNGTF